MLERDTRHAHASPIVTVQAFDAVVSQASNKCLLRRRSENAIERDAKFSFIYNTIKWMYNVAPKNCKDIKMHFGQHTIL